jgi:hypothetical protein
VRCTGKQLRHLLLLLSYFGIGHISNRTAVTSDEVTAGRTADTPDDVNTAVAPDDVRP